MSKKKRTRQQAFDVVMQALDLAQNLSFEAEARNPQFLRLRTRMSRKRLYEALQEKHAAIISATQDAYDLVEAISEWAAEYPQPSAVMVAHNAGVAYGKESERERIIKLIEEHDAAIVRDSLIALIKGENK